MTAIFEWSKLETQGSPPAPRYGHSFSLVESQAFVFGGACGGVEEESPPSYFQDLFVLDLASHPPKWREISQKGTRPTAREGHSLSAIGSNLYLFGGTGADDVCFNDLHVFNTETETWSLVEGKGTIPSKRNNHSAVVIDSKIFIFGGFLDGVAGNDIFIFDSKTQAWAEVKAEGTIPVERCDHTWVALGKKIALFGGAGDSVWYNDLHIFDSESLSWVTPRAKGTPPGHRDYHAAVTLDESSFLIFGGANDSDNWRHFNDIHVFHFPTATWHSPKPLGTIPPVRWGHAAVFLGKKFYSFGGTSENKFYNDLWQLHIYAEGDLPPKPARASVAPPKKENALEPVMPIPPKRTNYSTTTPIPSPRISVSAPTVAQVAPRDFSGVKNQMISTIESLFSDIQTEYLQLDQERAVFEAEKAAFHNEKRQNQELFEKQQKELAELIEQHRVENADLLRKRQGQYEEKLEEIRLRQEALKTSEEKFKQTFDQFMSQFSSFKAA